MKRYMRTRLLQVAMTLLLGASFSLTGCGLEALFIGLPTGGEHVAPEIKPVTKLTGKAAGLAGAEIGVYAGSSQIAKGQTTSDGSFDIELPKDTNFSNLTIEARLKGVLFKTIIPEVKQSVSTDAGTLDLNSTAITFVLEAALSARGLELINYPFQGMKEAISRLKDSFGKQAQLMLFRKMLDALQKIAEKQDSPLFQVARYTGSTDAKEPPLVEQSGLLVAGLGAGIDYCAKDDNKGCVDGVEKSTEGFDLALAQAAKSFSLPICTPGDRLQVIFTVAIDANAKDGNCSTIKQFKHARRYGGASCDKCSVYLTGGVHKSSGLNDPKINQQMSNWEPNKLQMYDDGTNGDLVAGDGIWTLTFSLPAPKSTGKACTANAQCGETETCLKGSCHQVLRLGYKYTFGLSGDVWGGTEEFPGNQRLLEIVDQNGDGFVARHDNFSDETANKDRVNTLQKKGATGMICFRVPAKEDCENANPSKNHPDCGCKIDQDGDSIPDTRERPWDKDQDCKADGFRVFANVQPLVGQCQ